MHRDVKPANVLLADGQDVSVKLFDFGLAVMHEDEALTAAGDIPGTLAYISPERLRGEPARPAADVWAVGVLLWEALAGRHPFWGGSLLDTARQIEEGAPSLASVRPDLDPAIVECVDRALAVDPKRRPTARMPSPPGFARSRPTLRRAAGAPSLPCAAARRSAARTVVPAGAAVLFAAWSAAALPFFPAGWPLALAALAGVLALLNHRLGLAFTLAVPVLPLGNYSLGLALVYGAAALAWLIFSWRDAEAGLFMTSGAAPRVHRARGRAARSPASSSRTRCGAASRWRWRSSSLPQSQARACSTASASPPRTARERPRAAVVRALERVTIVQAVVLGLVAVALPFARARGPWAAAGLAAFFVAAQLLAAPCSRAVPGRRHGVADLPGARGRAVRPRPPPP